MNLSVADRAQAADSSPALSYVVNTRNRLAFLSETLPRLIAARRSDEEIVVVDGASTDGTVEYVRQLHGRGDVDVFLSEPDKGEAHGLNKGILASRGELLKLVTDDDVYDYGVVFACREFMLSNPQCDVLAGNIANVYVERPEHLSVVWESEDEFHRYARGEVDCFFFNGLPLMLRRSALPLIGLFATHAIGVDTEYSLRISTVANIAWCSQVGAVRIDHTKSNYRTFRSQVDDERRRLSVYYGWDPPKPGKAIDRRSAPQRAKAAVRSVVAPPVKAILSTTGVLQRRSVAETVPGTDPASPSAAELLTTCDTWLAAWTAGTPSEIHAVRRSARRPGPTVAMIPLPFTGDAWEVEGNPGLRLMGQAIRALGWEVVEVPLHRGWPSLERLGETRPDVVHLHWPSSIHDFMYDRRRPGQSTAAFIARAHDRMESWCDRTRALGIPVVWQVHDLCSHHFAGTSLEPLDDFLHDAVFSLCDGVIVHETSCLGPVEERFGRGKPFAVTQLGDYSLVYGAARSKEDARRALSLDAEQPVLCYIGHVRPNRDPQAVIDTLRDVGGGAPMLLLAGGGMTGWAEANPDVRIVEFGEVTASTMRDVVCASDFVVNDAQRYLTSAVVRTAMSYGRPVLVRPFGTAIDMARGAAILIGEGPRGLEDAVNTALETTDDVYAGMVEEALARNAERSWRTAGDEVVRLYGELTGSR